MHLGGGSDALMSPVAEQGLGPLAGERGFPWSGSGDQEVGRQEGCHNGRRKLGPGAQVVAAVAGQCLWLGGSRMSFLGPLCP